MYKKVYRSASTAKLLLIDATASDVVHFMDLIIAIMTNQLLSIHRDNQASSIEQADQSLCLHPQR